MTITDIEPGRADELLAAFRRATRRFGDHSPSELSLLADLESALWDAARRVPACQTSCSAPPKPAVSDPCPPSTLVATDVRYSSSVGLPRWPWTDRANGES